MPKVFVNIGLSLDGYMAPEGMTMENWDKPEYKNWGPSGRADGLDHQPTVLPREPQAWTRGKTARSIMLRSTTERIGANIMDKRMFDQGERLARRGSVSHTGIRSYP